MTAPAQLAKAEGRPANADMVQGYRDGRDADAPEASSNRSRSYRHGFAVGRSELENTRLGTFDEVNEMADSAMAEDDAAKPEGTGE
jgi:hypothetical protein